MSEGRFALVTGAAQGLGFAAAKKFLELGFGGVLLVDRNAGKLAEAAVRLKSLGRAEIVAGDLMDVAFPTRAVAAAVAAFGRLDVVVNAAGNTERCGLDDTTPEAFERLFGVNTRAPLFMMQEAVKAMRPNRAGTIINMSSMLSHGGPPNLTTYSASKAAVHQLTRHLAKRLAPEITVNAIAPGPFESKMMAATLDAFGEQIAASSPMKRIGRPDDMAGAAIFLASRAGSYVTGTILAVDGGMATVGTN